jgi:deoxyribodipyrimidine photo-lyase
VERVTSCNASGVNGTGEYILYWMTAYRRRRFNFALERAVFWATELRKPLLVFEPVAAHYRWVSTRFHAFIIQGMRDNLREFENSAVAYYPFVERSPGEGSAVANRLFTRACLVVTDDFPAFEIPDWIAHMASRSRVLVERVDSNGLVPMRLTARLFQTASSFRRYIEQQGSPEFPLRDPLSGIDLPRMQLPLPIPADWPAMPTCVDRRVSPVASTRGGAVAARARLRAFLTSESEHSALSPYLHFGHISAHEVYCAVRNARQHPYRERLLDQLTTWRELGFNRCVLDPDYDRYESLPLWSRTTLAKHACDRRPVVYTPEQFENAETHDALWNRAQVELVEQGTIGNRLRMLWGKKILEWSATPQEALSTMIHLNNKYALDGRDPNSYNGIFWTLGRYDRPWGPERPIFGLVRYMSSERTQAKLGTVRRFRLLDPKTKLERTKPESPHCP